MLIIAFFGTIVGLCIGYWLGLWKCSEDIHILNVTIQAWKAQADYNSELLKRKSKEYDEVYTRMLAVNEQNAQLVKDSLSTDTYSTAPLKWRTLSEESKTRAIELFKQGYKRKEIAEALGISYSSAWKYTYDLVPNNTDKDPNVPLFDINNDGE